MPLVWNLAGKELASVPLEVKDVRALKQQLQKLYGYPRFRQVILRGKETLRDDDTLQPQEDLQLVLREFADATLSDANSLVFAVKRDPQMVEDILQRPQDPDLRDAFGNRPLAIAQQCGRTATLVRLLEAKADVDDTWLDGSTALLRASRLGQLEVAYVLLQFRANVDMATNDGDTALFHASRRGHVALVQALVEAKATTNLPDSSGDTPLICAASQGQSHVQIVRLLLEARADKGIRSRNGKTALICAAQQGVGDVDVLQALLESANINVPDRSGKTALMYASRRGQLQSVRLLLQARAAADLTDEGGETALILAASRGHLEVVSLLLEDLHRRPFMRDFCTVLQKFGQVLTLPTAPEVARKAAREAIDFLRPYADVERSLEFLLSNHTEGLVRRFGEAVLRGLAAAQSEGAILEDVGAELQQCWQAAVDKFEKKCHEVYELHFYSVFLEVKGDRALLDQTFRVIGGQLQLSRGSLLTCLEKTRPWAEAALKVFAKRQKSRLLERLHADALRSWKQTWQEIPRPPETGKLGAKFWDSNFIHLYKIAWPDLVEAFENFYLVGRCPTDLVRQLRLRVDPPFSHQVTKFSWQALLRGHNRISDILDMLIEEVMQDISRCIYRSNPSDDEVIDVEVTASVGMPPRARRADEKVLTRKSSGSSGQLQ
ncbi:unnamed protein product, partial [Symbiodinium pilosum]